jgi:hypothetical protein
MRPLMPIGNSKRMKQYEMEYSKHVVLYKNATIVSIPSPFRLIGIPARLVLRSHPLQE